MYFAHVLLFKYSDGSLMVPNTSEGQEHKNLVLVILQIEAQLI